MSRVRNIALLAFTLRLLWTPFGAVSKLSYLLISLLLQNIKKLTTGVIFA